MRHPPCGSAAWRRARRATPPRGAGLRPLLYHSYAPAGKAVDSRPSYVGPVLLIVNTPASAASPAFRGARAPCVTSKKKKKIWARCSLCWLPVLRLQAQELEDEREDPGVLHPDLWGEFPMFENGRGGDAPRRCTRPARGDRSPRRHFHSLVGRDCRSSPITAAALCRTSGGGSRSIARWHRHERQSARRLPAGRGRDTSAPRAGPSCPPPWSLLDEVPCRPGRVVHDCGPPPGGAALAQQPTSRRAGHGQYMIAWTRRSVRPAGPTWTARFAGRGERSCQAS